jgi:hypothetical protein
MSGWPTRFGFIAVILLLAGCGASEPVTVEQGALVKALVDLEDLPSRAEATEDLPEPCGPIPIIEERAAEAAVSKMFGLGETRLKEAVGYFPTEELSAAALEELASQERSECIRDSIERLSGSSEVKIETLEPLNLSDSESLARYAVTNSDEDTEQAIDIAAIKFDRCVAAIIIFQEDGSAEAARELFDTAAQRAAATCQ